MSKTQHLYSFKYSKSSDFKTFGVSGAYGGFTVNGNLNLNFYTETSEIPKESKHEIIDGRISKQSVNLEIPKELSSIREVLVGLNMDLNTAKSIIKWMQQHIEEFEERNSNVLGNETKNQK